LRSFDAIAIPKTVCAYSLKHLPPPTLKQRRLKA
jgi:hypothetical protein